MRRQDIEKNYKKFKIIIIPKGTVIYTQFENDNQYYLTKDIKVRLIPSDPISDARDEIS